MIKNGSSPLHDLHNYNGIRGLWRLMYGYRTLYMFAIFSVALAAVFRTLTLLLLRYFVDDLLAAKTSGRGIPLFALVFALLAILEGGAIFFKGKLAAKSAEKIIKRLRDFLFDHIQHLSFTYHDHTDSGSLIERVTSDVEVLRKFFLERAIEIGRILTLFVFNLIALLYLNVKLGLFSLVFIPFIFFQSYWFFKRISGVYEEYQAQEARVSSVLKENISAIRIVKAFSRQSFEKEKFEEVNQGKFKKGQKLMKLHAFFWPISDILCTMQLLFVYYIGAVMVLAGEITLGTYIAAAGLIVWIIWPIRNMGEVVINASQAFVSFGRITTIIKEPREGSHDEPEGLVEDESAAGSYASGTPPMEKTFTGAITFSDVFFSYKDGEEVLKGIDFSCNPGEKIAILGESGSGKTTLINLLPRFYECTSGKITINGVDIKSIPRSYLRKKIGIVEQEPFLFSRSIRDNILFGVFQGHDDNDVRNAAKAAAVHDVIMSFPGGYDTMVGEKGVTLSGGQKQRIVIARTLLKNPSILILDDATSSVDSETEHKIRNALAHLMEGRTSFIIAHRIQTVMEADKIIVLDHGRIIESGTHGDLVLKKGFYRKIFELQSDFELGEVNV